jgi:outer membrane receptor protein involved in Fe transport
MKNILLLTIVLLLISSLNAQPAARPTGAKFMMNSISGTVIDKDDNTPLEYANIVLFKSDTHDMVTGTVTNTQGIFNLEKVAPGSYYVEIKYIGYDRNVIENILIKPGGKTLDLGTVYLKKAAYDVGEVEVVAEKSTVEYKIDKKVINVGQQATSLSGTAVDALQISPSIRVDIDGTVSLRGSTNFTLLIDGKPSILDPSDALDQIPASAIENIEIITNPSAKYDPEGTSGIINVILKKNELSGLSGMVNLNGGTQSNYGGDALFEYRSDGLTISLGGDYANRNRPGDFTSYQETTTGAVTNMLDYTGTRKHGGTMYGFRGGLSYDFTPNDLFSTSFRFGNRDHGNNNDLNYSEWNTLSSTPSLYSAIESSKSKGNFYRASMDYTHKFSGDDHKLYLEANFSYRDMDEYSLNDSYDAANQLSDGKKYIEGGPGKDWRVKAEYKLPFNQTDYLEAGYNGNFEIDDEFNENYQFNLETNQYDFLDLYSHDTKSRENVHAAFVTYAAELGSFGYQLGLRGEYTDRSIELLGENQKFELDQKDFFPSIHTSYKIDDTFSLMASYSRRIHRPRGWFLEPFETWTDPYNVRKGNPDLKNEYINSIEAGFQKHFTDISFSLEGYYRNTNNNIERVRSVYAENVMLSTFANAGESNAIGVEMMLTLNPLKIWNLNLTGDLYDYKQSGQLLGEDFETKSFNYGLRMNNRLMFSKTFGSQIDLRWNSPTVTAQGERKGNFSINASAMYQIIPKELTAILQIRDILGTRKWEFSSTGPNFYSATTMEPQTPNISLTLRYSINNYKQKRNGNDNGDNGGDMEQEGGGEF